MSSEPIKRILNPENPITKKVKKTPMPPLNKNEWDTIYSKDLDQVNKTLDKIYYEDNNENNS